MTEEQVKEALSRGFMRLLANRGGYKCKFDETDHGVDFTVAEVKSHHRDAGVRLLETGRYLDLQLKCTCFGSVVWGVTDLKFDLEAKTYNDLVERWVHPVTPMWLVLFVLPDAPDQWLTLDDERVILRRGAYFWRPDTGATPTTNTSQIRITVPLANRLTLSFVKDRYEDFYQ